MAEDRVGAVTDSPASELVGKVSSGEALRGLERQNQLRFQLERTTNDFCLFPARRALP